MKIEEIIGWSAAQIAALSDEDLKKHFDHYLIVSRPDQQPRQKKQEQQVLVANPEFDKARKIAASFGISVPVFLPIKRKNK